MKSPWQPGCHLQAIQQRAAMNREVREFFHRRGVMEVETPALSATGNTDPYIDSFQVFDKGHPRYLHTSPEYPMKRLLAAGSGDIYQICKVWRQEEHGSQHNPEFTMLEYYRVGFSYHQLMQEVADLLHKLVPNICKSPEFKTYRDCFLESLGLDPHIATIAQLQSCASQFGLEGELDKQGWLDLLFTHVVEAGFKKNQLTFVYHYPASQSALASMTEELDTQVAERFEVYLGDKELGNGYQELVDGPANTRKLQQDAAERMDRGMSAIPVDRRFLAATQQGLPLMAGIALGLDRILMCRLAETEINRVISFAWELA